MTVKSQEHVYQHHHHRKPSKQHHTSPHAQASYKPITPASSPETRSYSSVAKTGVKYAATESKVPFSAMEMLKHLQHPQGHSQYQYSCGNSVTWYDPGFREPQPFVQRNLGKKHGNGNLTPPHHNKQRRFEDFKYVQRYSEPSPTHTSIKGTTYFAAPQEHQIGRDLGKMTNSEIYSLINDKLTLTEDQLRRNGYPTFEDKDPIANSQIIVAATFFDNGSMKWIEASDKKRVCARCKTKFVVNEDGSYPKSKCIYNNRGLMQVADFHVSIQYMSSEIFKYVSTPKSTGKDDSRNEAILALDCEMVYTEDGFAVGRVSMVNFDGEAVFDAYVKPPGKILDANTEYSGLTIEMLEKATDTLETCREKMFKLINSQTILIGHGLESDLKCLRMVHRNVVDTSILFRDRPRMKVALRKLSADLLNVYIQQYNPNSEGHCSIEDSLACMNLVKYKLENHRL